MSNFKEIRKGLQRFSNIKTCINNCNWEGINYSSVLVRGITSKYDGDFYCLNCLHSSKIDIKLKSHEKLCKNEDFCGIVIPSQKDNILQFHQYMKSGEMHYLHYLC